MRVGDKVLLDLFGLYLEGLAVFKLYDRARIEELFEWLAERVANIFPNFSADGLQRLGQRAVAMAKEAAEDPYNGLAELEAGTLSDEQAKYSITF